MKTNRNLQSGDDGGKGPQPLPGEQKQTPAPEIPKMPGKEVEQMPVTPEGPQEQEEQHRAA
ncbi:MAG: hypothetical protein KF744_10155 [Taibaiella sp.]|nr:hypothetical protein [Taibaiella sp.]